MLQLLFHSKNRNFLRLWLAQLISQFGDRIHQLALIGLVAKIAPGSTMALAKVMACTILPTFIIQPFAGVLVDRWDRRTILFVSDVIRGSLVLLIPFYFMAPKSMIPIYVIVFLVFSFCRFHVPAKMSIIPDLVHSENFLKANSLITTTGMIAAGLGAALGAFLVEYYGARNGFIIDSATFFLSAMFVFHISGHRSSNNDAACSIKKTSVWVEMKEGFHYIWQHKEIRFVINAFFVLFASAGAVYVVIVVFIQQTFNSVTKDLGVLAISLVAGLFAGVVVYSKWGTKIKWHKVVFSCLMAGGVVLVIFALMVHQYANLPMAMGLAFAWGLVISPIFVASNTVVHLVSDEKKRGQVFSALEIVIHFAFLITMFLSSWLSEIVGPFWILTVVGSVTGLIGFIGIMKKNMAYLS